MNNMRLLPDTYITVVTLDTRSAYVKHAQTIVVHVQLVFVLLYL